MSSPTSGKDGKPSGSGIADRASVREKIQKLRIQRTDSGIVSEKLKTPKSSTAPTNPEDRRKLLQRLRESRSSLEASRRSANLDKASDDGSDVRSEASSIDPTVRVVQPPLVFEPEEFVNIRNIDKPTNDFRLSFFEIWDRDKAIGAHLILPAAKPDWNYQCEKCTVSTMQWCGCCCSYCFPDMSNEAKHAISTEKQLILRRERKRFFQFSDIESQLQWNNNDWYQRIPDLGWEDDGIFQDFFPILLPILLQSESVHPSIASFTGPNVYLCRMTQRLLRELKQLKIKNGTLDDPSNSDPSNKPHTNKISFPEASLLRLLHHHYQDPLGLLQQNTARMFNISLQTIHNPINYSLQRTFLPHVHLEFGGRIGQWPVDATDMQRYGPLPNSFQYHANQGSLLKLFILHCNLDDHPLMNIEERHAIAIKESFAQYCTIFDQKMIEYLAQQLLTLLSDIMRWTEPPPPFTNPLSDEQYAEVYHLYESILQILPEVNELSKSIHQLTTKIYSEWKDIQEFRRRQSFTCSPINLRIRRLRSNLAVAGGKRKKGGAATGNIDDNASVNRGDPTPRIDTARSTGGVTNEWNMLCLGLEKLPQHVNAMRDILVKLAKRKLTEDETGKTDEADDDSGDPIVSYYRETNLQKTEEEWHREFEFLEKNAAELKQSTGLLPSIVIQLSENGVVTAEPQLPPIEIKRRDKIKRTRLKCIVRIDGQTASSTFYQTIKYPEFIVDFRCYLEMKVLKMPNDITVHIYTKNKRMSSRSILIGKVHLPPPGKESVSSILKARTSRGGKPGVGGSAALRSIHTHCNATTHGRFIFSSTEPLPDPNSSLKDKFLKCLCCGYYITEAMTTYSHQISGAVYCALEFDPLIPRSETNASNSSNNRYYRTEGIETTQLAVFPAAEQYAAVTNSFNQSLLADFTRENDFQQILPSLYEIDWNDPINDILLFLKSKKLNAIKGDYFRFFGSDYSIPFKSMLYDDENGPPPPSNSIITTSALSKRYAADTNNHQTVTLMNFTKLKCPMRLLLLKLRVRKPFLFYHLPIPLTSEEIKENPQLKQIIQDEISPSNQTLIAASLPPELTEKQLLGKESLNVMKSSNFLQRVRHSSTVSSRRIHKKRLQTSSVVLEMNFIPNFQFLPLLLAYLFERKRELKPKKKIRQPEYQMIDHCNLLVQVIGAKNIPLRMDFNDMGGGGGGGGADVGGAIGRYPPRPSSPQRAASPSVTTNAPAGAAVGRLALNETKLRENRRVHSFVEVRFQDSVIATTTFQGTTPMWKESLALPFIAPKSDYSPIGLDQLREEIFLTLFDEVYEDDRERGGFLEGESTTRVDRYYLGSFSIPFNALYHEEKIDGVFRLDTPIMNFGYEKRTIKNPGLQFTTGAGGAVSTIVAAGPPSSPTSQRLQQPNVSSKNLARSGSQSSLNGLLTTSQDEAEMNASPGTGEPNNEPSHTGPIPTNPIISTIQSSFTLLTLFWYFCFDCCPNFRSFFDKLWYYLSLPFASTPFANYYNNLYLRSNHILPETQLELISYASDDNTTYIKMMLTFDPLLPVSRELADDISPSSVIPDDRMLSIYAIKWLEQIRDLSEWTATRPYKLFAMNSSGLQVFICRFLTSQAPPLGYHSRRACLHLVSMIPFMKDSQSFIGEMDLWCTNQQFWEIGAGDEEEHSIMLYNYFRYFKNFEAKIADSGGNGNGNGGGGGGGNYSRSNLFQTSNNKKRGGEGGSGSSGYSYPPDDFIKKESVFLALGKAFPEGDTVYVLTRDWNRVIDDSTFSQMDVFSPENYLVINPWTGHVFSAIDPYCPLREIYSLVTPYNLWVNVQRAVSPNTIRYDILNPKNWRGFFNPRFPPLPTGLSTIQQDIDYIPTEDAYCETIEKTIFQSIRNSMRKWRSKRQRPVTTFHPEASNAMKDLLPKLEDWKKIGDYTPDRARMVRDGRLQSTVNAAEVTGNLDLFQEEVKKRLSHLLRTRVLRGFPINIPFTDVDEILTQVKTFCVHENNNPEVQFVLAVKAIPLFNHTISLWIFLGTLEVMNPSLQS